jgi:hypothetical protein
LPGTLVCLELLLVLLELSEHLLLLLSSHLIAQLALADVLCLNLLLP